VSAADDLEVAYPSVAVEIARRLLVCKKALANLSAVPASDDGWIAADLVTLQVRKICEMLLLGSSLAHLFGGNTNFDSRKWRPKDAFGELEKINKHPLPAPIELAFYSMPTGERQIRPASKPMPFSLLSAIYGHCGSLLHVPSAEKVLKGKIPPFDIGRFNQWVFGFKRLMSGHVLLLPELEKILLWTGKGDDKPGIYLMEANGPSIFDTTELPDFDLLTP
jgi:hypothetical protein